MALNRTPNHPACISGLFETLGEVSHSFAILSVPLNNLLDPASIHFLSGKFMPLNNGSIPTLTYLQESSAVACPSGPQPFSFSNKFTLNSLGSVVSREEIVSEGTEGTSHLSVIMSHTDWDAQLHVKTFGLYIVGRELKVIGRLVDFDMELNMAVVVIAHVSVTTGHQPVRTTPLASGSSSPAGKNGQTFTPLASGVNPAAAGKGKHKEATTSSGGDKGKGKMVGNHNRPDEEIDSDSDLDNFDKESEPKVKPKPCSRPCKNILKDAAKRMKKA
ncbi:hypothetical protein PCANC_25832 [Puccinia coronata f. sp. avenae]|uniref:Uncharacterized protein n=1 Tax=Puccinia coronata f. sp. avenae TaxID=200324 RepID=A0A2N5TUK3_9BASI|nr:hypothetical protein PCANC_25832 [Puccinia coronata f. sp. avenae]